MFGLAMVDRVVDTMVRPEVVMRAMQEGKLAPKKHEGAATPGETEPAEQVKWTSGREGANLYFAYAGKADAPDDERVTMVFERNGFANWKLTELRLPLGK